MSGGIMNPVHLATAPKLTSSPNLRSVTYVVRFFRCHSLCWVMGLFPCGIRKPSPPHYSSCRHRIHHLSPLRTRFRRVGSSLGLAAAADLVRHASEGVLLVATGERHRLEACEAVPRIRPMLGGRPIWLVCDRPDLVPPGVFDHVSAHPDVRQTYRDKIRPLADLPFSRTLFLDTDVELLQPVEDVFRLLAAVDLLGCHAPVRWCQWVDPLVPDGFCELNSGVLGLRRGRRVRRLIRTWLATYDRAGVRFDQASLRSALWQGCQRGLRLWVLPPEYNLRTTKPWIAGKGLPVKIVHGRIPEAMRQPLARYLNDNIEAFRASSAFPTHQNAGVLELDPALLAPPVAVAPPLSAADLPAAACRRLFVLGAGRSGTSLLAGLFRRSGLFMGDGAYRSRAANPHGFYEDREVNAINEALLAPLLPPPPEPGAGYGHDVPGDGQRWLARLPLEVSPAVTPELRERILALFARGPSCFKDPRFCHTLAVWRELLPEGEAAAAHLCVFRHPAAVLTSVLQEVQSAPYLQQLAISPEQVLQSWCSHYRHVLEHHAGHGRWLFLAYEQLLEPTGLDRLEAFSGHPLDRTLPEAGLNRSRPQEELSLAEPVLVLYRELCARAGLEPQ